jgi:hypothetical protein
MLLAYIFKSCLPHGTHKAVKEYAENHPPMSISERDPETGHLPIHSAVWKVFI